MAYHHHTANYAFGQGSLNPEQRIIVGNRKGPKEPRRVAAHLGVSPEQPNLIIDHTYWADGEYLPTFLTKRCLDREQFFRYRQNYPEGDGKTVWGQGLKNRVVNLVHTFSNSHDIQSLDKINEFIAWSAKYCGAEAVALLAYTLDHSAQERGVHQTNHPRMQTEDALLKFDGQGPLSQLQLLQYATSGIDVIINPHNHCPEDTQTLCDEVNQELLPLHERSIKQNSTLRYRIDFINLNLAPMVGLFIKDFGNSNLGFDLSNGGENVLFMGPDEGILNFVKEVRKYADLPNSAIAGMNKKRSPDGNNIDILELTHVEGLTEERGIQDMHIILLDDAIRSGTTMQKNVELLRGIEIEGIIRDPRIKGTPKRVAVYATRTNFAGNSPDILNSHHIDDVIITNADPRGIRNLGALDQKTQMIWINFLMGEAVKAVEKGEDPNDVLTQDYIRKNRLLKIETPHGHSRFTDQRYEGRGII